MVHTFRDCEGGAPLIPQNVEADAAVAVDVWVVDASGEVDLWGLERVVGREVDCEEEDAAGVWRVAGTHDGRLPVELWTRCQSSWLTVPIIKADVRDHRLSVLRCMMMGGR